MKRVGLLVALWATPALGETFLEEFPALKQFIFQEPQSPLRLGMSLTPVGITKNKTYFGASFFQAHFISGYIDWELISATIGLTSARSTIADSRQFTLRTAPKIRVLGNVSFGLLGGYELVTFPNVRSRLYKNRFSTPEEQFSSRGWIYGAQMAISFKSNNAIFRVSPNYWIQTYPHRDIKDGWKYFFVKDELQSDIGSEQLKADSILAIELGVLL